MVLARASRQKLGNDDTARLAFADEAGPRAATPGRRLLVVDDRPAFELSFWCGTCPFLFERLGGATDTLSLEGLSDRLTAGLDDVDAEVVEAFSPLLPAGDYVPFLLEVRPRLVLPVGDGDYFSHEQVTTWGIEAFWGLPVYPRTPYYRTFETVVDAEAHLYEFVVPMVPPSWNDPVRVAEHAQLLAAGSRPTAVAVSTLDVCAPAMENGTDWYSHWCLTHFVLDGHHKLEAAAQTGWPLTLLSLVSVAGSLASGPQIARLADLRARPPEARPATEPVEDVNRVDVVRTPVIVRSDADVELYESVAAAEAEIESPEVEAGDVEAWDAAGRPLEARIVGKLRKGRWTTDILPVRLVPTEAAAVPERPADLLRAGLALVGHPYPGRCRSKNSSSYGGRTSG